MKPDATHTHGLLINSDDGTADVAVMMLTEDTTTVADIKRMVADSLARGAKRFTVSGRTRSLRRKAKAAFRQMGIQL